jgi:OOP family OmpA-OmpF porin
MLSRSLLALGLAVAAPAIAAAQPVLGPYISLGAGADLLQNENFHPAFNDIPKARSYRFDIGPAGEASLGYGLGNGLRIELEGDYADNHVRGVTFSTPLRAGGHEQQYGGFVNLLEDRCRCGSRSRPISAPAPVTARSSSMRSIPRCRCPTPVARHRT